MILNIVSLIIFMLALVALAYCLASVKPLTKWRYIVRKSTWVGLLLLLASCTNVPPLKTPGPTAPVIVEGRPLWIMCAGMETNSVYRASWIDSTGTAHPFAWAETFGKSPGSPAWRTLALFHRYDGADPVPRHATVKVERMWWR